MSARRGGASIFVPSANLLLTGSAPHATVDEIATYLDAHLRRVFETFRPLTAGFRVGKKFQRVQMPEAIQRMLWAGLRSNDPHCRAWSERYLKSIARKTPAKPGPKPGKRRYAEDAELLKEMARLIAAADDNMPVSAAACAVADRAWAAKAARGSSAKGVAERLRKAFAARRRSGEN